MLLVGSLVTVLALAAGPAVTAQDIAGPGGQPARYPICGEGPGCYPHPPPVPGKHPAPAPAPIQHPVPGPVAGAMCGEDGCVATP
ncbi:hypothetical protein GCM10023321_40760 [Pseudonocardia eucalypti]|uniref:Uncharacterized protein n=1 Tax=Pseudonocardia eucalypti TaxID=648755 RepID=A0ABP9QB64_9PSEU|nr:hypothetical protein [Pseudonocardia eucalypti]